MATQQERKHAAEELRVRQALQQVFEPDPGWKQELMEALLGER